MGIPTNEENPEIETQPLTAEMTEKVQGNLKSCTVF